MPTLARVRRRMVSTPASFSICKPWSGALASVMSVSIRDSGQTTRLPRADEFREIGERNDQLVGAFEQFALGARDERIAFDEPSGRIEIALMNILFANSAGWRRRRTAAR